MATTTLLAGGEPEPDPPRIPVGPLLSIFDPLFIGIDEYGQPVYIRVIYRNMLLGGEPGAGKSSLLSTIVAHAALSTDTRLCLLDGKQVELGMWRRIADEFVGPDLHHAITTLRRLQRVMDNRYRYLLIHDRRKIVPGDAITPILVVIDEIAVYSATLGEKKDDRERFSALLRDLTARGRAVGIMVIAATQRPSADIIPTSLRDLFAWRFAGRCTTDISSDIVLGFGWASRGFSANTVAPEDQGVGYLIAEGGTPRLIKAAYLTDDQIKHLAAYAAWIRRPADPATLTIRGTNRRPDRLRRAA